MSSPPATFTVVLVDECTSGVDPLSRRALWKAITSFRESRTIVFTTHVCSTSKSQSVQIDNMIEVP